MEVSERQLINRWSDEILKTNLRTDPYYEIQNGEQVFRYRKYALNPIVKTAMKDLINAAFWPGYHFMPMNDYKQFPAFEEIDKYIINLVKNQMERWASNGMEAMLKGILENAMSYGYCICQPFWDVRQGNWVLYDLQIKPSWNFNYQRRYDKDELDYIQHYPSGTILNDPKDFNCLLNFVWPRFEHYNWYGVSELQSIMTDIDVIQQLEALRNQGIDRIMVRPIIHYFDDTGSSSQSVQESKMSVDIIESQVVLHLPMRILPPGSSTGPLAQVEQFDRISVLEDRASQPAVKDIGEIIKFLEARINRVFGSSDSLGKSGIALANGSYGKAKIEWNGFISLVESAEAWLENEVNGKIVDSIIYWNYPALPLHYQYPRLRFGEVEEEYNVDKVNYLAAAQKAGFIQSNEPFIRETLGFPPLSQTNLTERDESVFKRIGRTFFGGNNGKRKAA